MPKAKTIAVIGGGSAGFTAAKTARGLGARVLLFMGDNADRASLCVNQGCMPSKTLFEPIDAMHHARRHGWLTVEPKSPNDYLAQIVAWKDREIARFRAYRQNEIRDHEAEDFSVIRANARFVDPHTLESQGKKYKAEAFILATGSTPRVPPIEGLDVKRDGVWTNEEILNNRNLPESLVVIGGGAIGLELSLRYARLGSQVTVVTRSQALPHYPAKYGERIATIYEREGIPMLTGRELTKVRLSRDGFYEVSMQGPEGYEVIAAQRLLLATGRRPALDGLNLERANVALNKKNLIDVGGDMRVLGQDHIFAAGDVNGQRMVVHHAHIEAGIAAENAVGDGTRRWDKRSNVQVVFSDPEFAYAGLHPEDAEKAGHKVIAASVESRDVAKLHLAGDDLGFGEFIAAADTHRLLGAGLLCSDASNLIHMPAYAIDHEHTVDELANAEYYHPTKIEIVSDLADELCSTLGGTPYCRAEE